MSKNKGILELESIVKEIYARDKSDPELYIALRNLAEKILVVKKIVKTRREVDELSHNLATDFYLRISSGDLEVVCWTKYIHLTLLTYRNNHYAETSKCDLVIKDTTEACEFSKDLYYSSRFNLNKDSSMEFNDYIASLPKFILIQFDKVVKYKKDSLEYTEVLISVLTSIIRRKYLIVNPSVYNDIDYIEFVVKCLMRRLNNYMNKVCISDKVSYRWDDIINPYQSFSD